MTSCAGLDSTQPAVRKLRHRRDQALIPALLSGVSGEPRLPVPYSPKARFSYKALLAGVRQPEDDETGSAELKHNSFHHHSLEGLSQH